MTPTPQANAVEDGSQRLPRAFALVGETFAELAGRWVVSVTIALTSALTVGAVLLTVGRSVALETDVLAAVDAAGTRTITVRDTSGLGRLPVSAVDRVGRIAGVTTVVGLGPIIDAHQPGVVGAHTPVPVRAVVGDIPVATPISGIPFTLAAGSVVVGTRAARAGLSDGVGTLELADGRRLAAIGTFEPSPGFEQFGTVALMSDERLEFLRAIVVLVDDSSLVVSIAATLRDTLGAERPAEIGVETSSHLVAVRDAVDGRLGQFSRSLLAWALVVSLAIILVLVTSAVRQARRDLGRRRALGATRSAVIALILGHVACSAAIGSLVGALVGVLTMRRMDDVVPLGFTASTIALAVMTATVAALPPVLMGAFRDPVLALRTP